MLLPELPDIYEVVLFTAEVYVRVGTTHEISELYAKLKRFKGPTTSDIYYLEGLTSLVDKSYDTARKRVSQALRDTTSENKAKFEAL
jgi:hypothetical protein